MAMPVKEIRQWLKSLKDYDLVGIDEGGLCLRVVDKPGPYIEIGGMGEDEEER